MTETNTGATQIPPTCDLGPDDTLYFLHIHKTAGSSLREYINSKFPVHRICKLRWELPFLVEAKPEHLAQWRVFCGHYGYYLEGILGRPVVYVTMLRDPVERTISAFYDQKWREDLWLHDHIKDMTLEDYVFDHIGTREVINFQTRTMALDSVEDHFRGYAELWRDAEETKRVLGDRALLELAKERIAKCACVGFQDAFPDSMRLLAYTFGWPKPEAEPRKNIRRTEKEELSDRVLGRIREITALDLELYDFARERFDRYIAALTDEMIDARHREVSERGWRGEVVFRPGVMLQRPAAQVPRGDARARS